VKKLQQQFLQSLAVSVYLNSRTVVQMLGLLHVLHLFVHNMYFWHFVNCYETVVYVNLIIGNLFVLVAHCYCL